MRAPLAAPIVELNDWICQQKNYCCRPFSTDRLSDGVQDVEPLELFIPKGKAAPCKNTVETYPEEHAVWFRLGGCEDGS